MKKILALCIMTLLVLSLSVNLFAAPGAFVSSPSGNPAPIVITFEPRDEDCTARLVLTPYSQRHELPKDLRALLETAYEEIADASDLTTLNAALATVAAAENIKGEDLAVSDLFDLHVTGCDTHDDHVNFDITLSADTLNHFVGLLHMTKDGAWELVENAAVIQDGKYLKFTVETFSPFAIVVDTSEGSANFPPTSDNTSIYVYAVIMGGAALAIVLIFIMKRRKSDS